MVASIFKRCKTRNKAAAEAASKNIAVAAGDSTADIQTKILLNDLGAEDNQELYIKVVELCAVDYRVVNAERGIQKGIEYETAIRSLIIEELEKQAEEHEDEAQEETESEEKEGEGDQEGEADGAGSEQFQDAAALEG